MKVVDFNTPSYIKRWKASGANRYNGAYYYAREIAQYMIPSIQTNRNWILVNQEGEAYDHSIVFVHNNLHPEHYDWLLDYKDLILICGIPETCEKVKHIGEALYLPLSIDVEYVKKFSAPKKRKVAFVGRSAKRTDISIPDGADYLENMPREELLQLMAKYEDVYAVGRCALEAKVLGCNVLPYDPRFPDPDIWKVRDSREMVLVLQKMLNSAEKKLYQQAIERGMR